MSANTTPILRTPTQQIEALQAAIDDIVRQLDRNRPSMYEPLRPLQDAILAADTLSQEVHNERHA